MALIVHFDDHNDTDAGRIHLWEGELDALRNGHISAFRGVLNRDKHQVDHFLSTQCNVLYVKYTE